MPTRGQRRAARLRERADIGVLLAEYGYGVLPDDTREQQYRCDLHGVDNKPSARYYPRTNSTYCFACGKARDPISLVMDKEGLSFREACDKLEQRFNLPALPWEEGEDKEEESSAIAEIDEIVASGVSFDREARRMDRFLDNLVHDRSFDMQLTLGFVEVYDRIMYGVRKQGWSEVEGKASLARLHRRILEKLREVT